ncbi:MAG: hypothetical protein R3B65_02590 [Candidatus Paceibacterota bacterium]
MQTLKAHIDHGDTEGACEDGDKISPEVLACSESIDLKNGSFEKPLVTSPAGWNLFTNGTTDLDWTVSWVSPTEDAPEPKLEIQAGVMGWVSYDGDQHAELDSDHGSPAPAQLFC